MATKVYTGNIYERPSICVDSSGDVWVLVMVWSSSQTALDLYKNGTQETGFGGPITGSTIIGTSNLTRASMAIDSSDVLHIACQTDVGGQTRDVAYATYTISTSTLSSWVEISSHKDAANYYNFNVVINDNDDVFVGYTYTDKYPNAWLCTNESGSWVEYQVDTTKSGVFTFEAMGLDSTGDVWIFYRESTGGYPHTWYYKVWDSSASSLGSRVQVGTHSTTVYGVPRDAVWDGTYMYTWWASYATSAAEINIQEGSSEDTSNTSITSPTIDQAYCIYGAGDDVAFAYIDSKMHMIVTLYNTDDSYHYIWNSGTSSWDSQGVLHEAEVAASEICKFRIAQRCTDPSENYGSNLWYTYYDYDNTGGSWELWYDVIYPGTPAKSNKHCYLWGGIHPTSDTPAYLMGDPPRGTVSAFLYGHYDVGGNTRAAEHAFLDCKPSYVNAFLAGQQNMYYDVVEFTTQGSTGTQNIISSNLGGNAPQLVFFVGSGCETHETARDDLYYFHGVTDGTYEWWAGCQQNNGSGSSTASSGSVSTARCGGFSYGGGGSFNFDSWYQSGANSGVTINWTTGCSEGNFKCAAFFVACDTPGLFSIEQGTFAPDNAADNDEVEITGLGFQPDYIMFYTPQGGCGIGVGIAQRARGNLSFIQSCANADLNSGYFNYPGYCNRGTNNSDRIIADGITSTGGDGTPGWKVLSFDEDGFTMQCTHGDGVYDGPDAIWMALKIELPTIRMEYLQHMLPSSAGDNYWNTNIRPVAAVGYWGSSQNGCTYPVNYFRPRGWMSVDGSPIKQAAFIGSMDSYVGTVWDVSSVSTNSSIVGTSSAYISDYESNRIKIYQPSTGNIYSQHFIFGYGVDAIPSKKHAYTKGHAHFQPAHTWGKSNLSSSKSAFFHVVDAQDDVPCYMSAINPSRSDIPAYMAGYDDPCILYHEFQLTNASGNQDITTPILNGATPKAAIVWLFGVNSLSVTNNGESLFSIGISDGTNTYSNGIRGWNDTSGYFNQTRSVASGEIICVDSGYETYDYYGPPHIDAKATVTFIANGMRLNFNNAPGDTYYGVVQFYAGTNISADCGLQTVPGTPSDVSITAPGWEPDMVFMMGAGYQLQSVDNSFDMAYDNLAWGWAINDDRSPRPTQITHTTDSYRGSSSSNGWQPSEWVNRVTQDFGWTWPNLLMFTDNDVYFKSFDATGFTLHWNGVVFSNSELVWLAIKWGPSRKAGILVGSWDFDTGVDYELTAPSASGDYKIIPESAIMEGAAHHKDTNNYLQIMALGINYSFIGNINRAFISTIGGIWWDVYSQFYDQIAMSRTGGSNNMHLVTISSYIDREFKDGFITGNWRFANRNGVILNLNYVDTSVFETTGSRYWWYPPKYTSVFYIGLAEYTSKTPAFLHGERADWPGRTPRGCYLEGTTPYVYDNQAAFIEGKEPAVGSTDAFLWGQNIATSFFEAFLKGLDTATSSNDSYLAGGINVTSSTPAWCRSGWDTSDNQVAFLEGIPSRSSMDAFLEGFSANPISNIPAFTNGGGPWPFTDNYTGADEAAWDSNKWISTEEL